MKEPVFYFNEYRVRPVKESDRVYIDKLIAADPFHNGCMDADWFLSLPAGEAAWAVEDAQGNVVFYFKTQTAVRLSIQFGEQPSSVNRAALQRGMAWLEGMLIQNHFREVIFDTAAPFLAAMAKRRLGFVTGAPGTLYRVLPTPEASDAMAGHWHHRPTASGKAG